MKKHISITSFIAVLVILGVAFCVWHFSPHPPQADIITMADVNQLNTDEDWHGKIVRLEITDNSLESYNKNTKKYGFLGKVKVKGSPGEVYGQFNMYDQPNIPNVLIGDVFYVRVTELVGKGNAFGPMIKGDIMYIEKGRH